MAAKFINRIASPMELCLETLDQPTDKVEKLKRSLEAKQGIRSRILLCKNAVCKRQKINNVLSYITYIRTVNRGLTNMASEILNISTTLC